MASSAPFVAARDRPIRRIVMVAVAIVIGACTFLGPRFEMPTSNRPAAAAGEATGGRIAMDGRCVFLAGDNGPAANLLWPPGYVATGPPLAIEGPSGEIVLRGGDEVTLGVEELGVRAVAGCPIRVTWAIGEIVEVNGDQPAGPVNPQATKVPGHPH